MSTPRHAPASEDTEPHRWAPHNSRVTVEREVVGEEVFGLAATETDKVGCVATDDEKTAGSWRVAQ